LVVGSLFRDRLDANLIPSTERQANHSYPDHLQVTLQALVLLYPVVDQDIYNQDKELQVEIINKSKLLTPDMMRFFFDSYLPAGIGDHARTDRRVNVLGSAIDLNGLAPTLLVTAGCDVLFPQNKTFALKMQQSGADITHLHYPLYQHGFVSLPGHQTKELFENIERLVVQ